MREPGIEQLLLRARDHSARLKLAAATAAAEHGGPPGSHFRVGLSSSHDVQVHRTLQPSETGSGGDGAPSLDPLAKYAQRVEQSHALGRADTTAPAVSAAGAAAADPAAAGARMGGGGCVPKPWVSFGSPSSVVLNWLPAGKRFDPREAPKAYLVQQRTVHERRAKTVCSAWAGLEEAHTGSVPAHTVRGLR